MIIVFGNQKGGAGKSTLAMLFSNYISLINKTKAIILDMDYQRSILSQYEEERILDNPELYEVIGVDLDTFPEIIDMLRENKDLSIIVDLPGKIDDDALIPVIQAADVFVIPFEYEKKSYQSTLLFDMITKELNPGAKKVFIPNRLKTSVNYSLAKGINEEFQRNGILTKPLSDRIAFQRITTRHIPSELLPLIKPVFESITTVANE